MANSNDLPNEMKKLVVEEKANETNWNNLPFEIKEMVVKEMDLETRTRLKLCSKSDKYLVESIRMLYDKLDIDVWEWKKDMVVDVKLYSDKSRSPDLDLRLQAKKNNVFINPEKSEKRIQCSNDEDAKDMVKQMFLNIFFGGNLRFKEVKAEIQYPEFIEDSEFTIHANEVDIYASSQNQIIQWLKNVAPGVKTHLTVSSGDTVEGIGNIPAIINADVLRIYCPNDINDDQIATFKCTSLYIKHNNSFTGKGMQRLIKKAVTNDYPKGTIFEIYLNPNVLLQYWNDVIDGLDIKMTESEDIIDGNRQVTFGWRDGQVQMILVGFRSSYCFSV